MKKLYFLILVLFITSVSFGQMINEFYPNPPGSDPANNQIELKGTPNTSFNLWLISIENDVNSSLGAVDRIGSVNGTFDANGLAVVSIPDLEDPSFTLVLATNFNGILGDDLDSDDDGSLDNISGVFGTVLDAVGISNGVNDDSSLYGAGLGGSNILFNGISKPELVFRDGISEDWYVVVDNNPLPDETVYTVHDEGGSQLNIGNFNTDPTSPTFDLENPSTETQNTENFSNGSVSMFPNPNTSGTLHIKTANNEAIKISIFDLLGKQVLLRVDLENDKLNVSHLQSGLYFVNIMQARVTVTKKLVIE